VDGALAAPSLGMKHLVILGAGTAGTMVANRMRRRLSSAEWRVIVIDPDATHLYQPGLLFLPFGANDESAMQRPRRRTLRAKVEWIARAVEGIDTKERKVRLEGDDPIPYDLLVIATGARLRFDLTPGLAEARGAGNAHDFYTLDGAKRLRETLAKIEKGRVVVNVVEMPIKCPVAPLEFLFLADAFFTQRGVRKDIELVYATPLDAAFTRPLAASMLGGLLTEKKIHVETSFSTGEVDGEAKLVRSYDEREVPFDVLVSIPTHSGAEMIEQAGLGNELAFVATDKNTLAVKDQEGVFALGDATDLPASKAGSVAHFQSEVLEENLMRTIRGEKLEPLFDGHANCFVESGFGKALLIDFNYEVEPLPGRFPMPGVGPFALLEQSKVNHLGKLAFRWLYWNGLLPGRPLPISPRMSMAGKHRPSTPLLPA
jgi:sulfide:quinone oxidoreductase